MANINGSAPSPPDGDRTLGGGDYPAAWEYDSLLTDGRAVGIRPVRPADADLLIAFHADLSPEAVYRRYFAAHPTLSRTEATHFATVDYRDRMCFIAVVAGQLVGYASYDRLPDADAGAEIAFCVAGTAEHHGVATLLFETLAAYARRLGIGHFVAEVQTGNRPMLDVFAATGLDYARTERQGVTRVDLDLRPTPRYLATCDEREAVAEAASVRAILRPRSVAVVGAGRQPGNPGHEIVRALLSGRYPGSVYPVNPHATSVCDVAAYPSLSSLPEVVDLAVVAVPQSAVSAVVEEAASVGVGSLVIVTAGFAETGAAGSSLEARLLSIARGRGMRVVGPNCLGVINTDPAVRLNATFAGIEVAPGHLALVSQSGALGIAVAEQARSAGIGLSTFVSVGNKLDVSSNDVLCFLERDARTSVIALYLESFGNARKFARITRRIGRTKPIVALTAGRSSSGARGARSHTAAAATPDVVVSALLSAAGVIKVEHLDELVDVSGLLLTGKLPGGDRVGLIGNSGGPLILAADACEAAGLAVPELDNATKAVLRRIVVPTAAVANPVDLTADGTASQIEQALAVAALDEGIDAIAVVVTILPGLTAGDLHAAVERAARSTHKPIVVCALGNGHTLLAEQAGYATVPSPERAAAAIAHVSKYAAWRRGQATAPPPAPAMTPPNAVASSLLERHPDGGWLDLDEAARLLGSYGVPLSPTYAATSPEEAADLAASIGFPVALKARSGEIVHKSEVGGVAIGLEDALAVGDAYRAMAARLGATMGGAVVQPMAASGIEAIVGVVTDANFGPLVMVGLGGVATDLLGDRVFGVPPLSSDAIESMLSRLRAAPLLTGYRGAAPVDRRALVHLIKLVSLLAEEVPELAELDLNPVVLSPDGVVVVDCKVRLGPARLGPGPLFRSLRARR